MRVLNSKPKHVAHFIHCRYCLRIVVMVDLLPLISGFRRDVDEICGLLGSYTASCGNYLPMFRDKMGPIRCPETSVNNYQTAPCNYPEDHRFDLLPYFYFRQTQQDFSS